MKIALETLEALVIAETNAPRSYEMYRVDIFEQACPLLYIAARSGGISLLDALIACRKDTELTRIIAKNFLTPANADEARQVAAVMSQDVPEYANRIRENYVLEEWLETNAQ